MKKILIYSLLLILSMPLSAQRVLRLLEVGDEHFRKAEYTLAKEAYETILRRDRSANVRREVSFRLGQTHQQMLNYAEARKWYTLAMNVGYNNPEIFMHLSEMSLGLEDFDLAIDYATRYLEKRPDDRFGRKLLESARFSKENYYKETLFEVTNERALNTTGQEWGIAFFPDDRILFASTFDETGRRLDTRTGTGYSSIYESTLNRSTGEWSEPQLIKGKINTEFYEGFLSYDAENQIGYFMNCGGPSGTRETCDIYTAKYNPERNTWSEPVIFPINSDSYNIGYPSISEDGYTLYFGSDMPGGYGGYDLYKIVKDPVNDRWESPENLGPTINTSLNDSYPFIAGNILYFSSFGHPGFGGFDIFYSEIKEDGGFSKPVNMGSPINSSADDFGFIINKEYSSGFFTSDRPGGVGNDDIYSFRIVSRTFDLKGIIVDGETGAPMPGIEVILYGDDDQILKVNADRLGRYTIPNLDSEVNYIVEVVEDGYTPFSESLSVKDKLIASRFLSVPEFEKNVTMHPAPAPVARREEIGPDGTFPVRPAITGITEGLPTVHFDFARFDLTTYARMQLDSVLRFLDTQPGAGLVIHAHTDEVSGYLFNFYLSQKRAHSIIDYLVSRGVTEDRLYPFGHGKMELKIVNAQTPEEHRQNRRATFEVITLPDFNAFLADAPRHSFRFLNSLHKEAHYARGVEFMVQFAATRNPVHPQYYRRIMEAFPQLDIMYYYDIDRFHRYSVGTFDNLNRAMEVHRRLRELGFDAFVVAFRDGERISLSEANQLLQNQ